MFRVGSLLEIKYDDQYRCIMAIPSTKIKSQNPADVRNFIIRSIPLLSRTWRDEGWFIGTNDPPFMYLGFIHLPDIGSIGNFVPKQTNEYFVHKVLHKGKIWFIFSHKTDNLADFVREAK